MQRDREHDENQPQRGQPQRQWDEGEQPSQRGGEDRNPNAGSREDENRDRESGQPRKKK